MVLASETSCTGDSRGCVVLEGLSSETTVQGLCGVRGSV